MYDIKKSCSKEVADAELYKALQTQGVKHWKVINVNFLGVSSCDEEGA